MRSNFECTYNQPEFDRLTVGCTYNQITNVYNHYFLVVNAPIGLIFGSRWPRASRAHCETTKNVRILFACLLKVKECDVLDVFQLSSEFN